MRIITNFLNIMRELIQQSPSPRLCSEGFFAAVMVHMRIRQMLFAQSVSNILPFLMGRTKMSSEIKISENICRFANSFVSNSGSAKRSDKK